jgi:hypothetical protein
LTADAIARILDQCPLQTLNLITRMENVNISALLAHIAGQKDENRLTLKVIRTPTDLGAELAQLASLDPTHIKEVKMRTPVSVSQYFFMGHEGQQYSELHF